MEKKGGQQLFYILNPPVSTKQNLLAEVFCQCFARDAGGSTPQEPMKPGQKPAWETHKEPSAAAAAAREASSPMARQMKAAQELTLPAQTEMLKGSF